MQALDTRHKRRAGAIFALFALLASLMVGFANPASANSEVVPKGISVGGNVYGSWNGQQRTFNAGLIGVDTDNNGTVDAYAYCIDLGTNLANNQVYTEGTWNQATVPNLGKITWILQNYDPSVPANRTQDVAKAVQSAIWHFSDGFNLSLAGDSGNNQAVRDLYSSILANAQDVPEPSPTLTIAPADQTEEAGTGLIYNVQSSAPGPVALALSGGPAGAKVVPAAGGVCDVGAAPINSVNLDGGNAQVCVYSDQPGGPAELTGTVSQAKASGRVFLRPGSQKLIFAGGGTVTATAKAKGSWTDYSTFTIDVTCETVTITSNGKDLSNIIWQGVNSTESQKADGLTGKTYVIDNDPANPVNAVWIKAGNNKLQSGDPSPLPPNGGNQGVGAYFPVAAPQGCVPDPGASAAIECVDNDGTIVVTLNNTGYGEVTFDVTNPVTSEVVTKTVGAKGTDTVTFGGLPDGTHTYPVTANGEDVDQTVTVACDAPGVPEVGSVVECTADGGEVTIVLGNEGVDGKNLPVTYRVTDPRDGTSQDVTVDAGETREVVYEEVADGEYTFGVDVIEGDEVVESFDQTVAVRCAEPEVLGLTIECADGGVVVRVGNPGTNPTEMVVRKGDTVIDTVVVEPGDTLEVLVPMEEGETATITVTDGDDVIASETLTLNCEDPTPPTPDTTTPSPDTTVQVLGATQTPTAVSPSGALPFTGGDVVRTLGLGLLLAAAGFGLVLATRRRRS